MKTNKLKEQQEKQKAKAEQQIINYLADGKRHQYNDIVTDLEGKLSRATISKRLKDMEKSKKIFREVDLKSGKYPYPVYYTISQDFKKKIEVFCISKLPDFEKCFTETNSPDQLIKNLYYFNLVTFLETIKSLQEHKTDRELKNNLLIIAECMVDVCTELTRKKMMDFIKKSLYPDFKVDSVYLTAIKEGKSEDTAILLSKLHSSEEDYKSAQKKKGDKV